MSPINLFQDQQPSQVSQKNNKLENKLREIEKKINGIDGGILGNFKNKCQNYYGFIEKTSEQEVKDQYIMTLNGVLNIYDKIQDKLKNQSKAQSILLRLDETLGNMLKIDFIDATVWVNRMEMYNTYSQQFADILVNIESREKDPLVIRDVMGYVQKRSYEIYLVAVEHQKKANELKNQGDEKQADEQITIAEKIKSQLQGGLENLAKALKNPDIYSQIKGALMNTYQLQDGKIVTTPPIKNFLSPSIGNLGISAFTSPLTPRYFFYNQIGNINTELAQTQRLGFNIWYYGSNQEVEGLLNWNIETFNQIRRGGNVWVLPNLPDIGPFDMFSSKELPNYLALVDQCLKVPQEEKELERVRIQLAGQPSGALGVGEMKGGKNDEEVIAAAVSHIYNTTEAATLFWNTTINNINLEDIWNYIQYSGGRLREFKLGGTNQIIPPRRQMNEEIAYFSNGTMQKISYNPQSILEKFAKMNVKIGENEIIVLPYVIYQREENITNTQTEENITNTQTTTKKITQAGAYIVSGENVYHFVLDKNFSKLEKKLQNKLEEELTNIDNGLAEIKQSLNNASIGGGIQRYHDEYRYEETNYITGEKKETYKEEVKIGGYVIGAYRINKSQIGIGGVYDINKNAQVAGAVKWNDNQIFVGVGQIRAPIKKFKTLEPLGIFGWGAYQSQNLVIGGYGDENNLALRAKAKDSDVYVDFSVYSKTQKELGGAAFYLQTKGGYSLFFNLEEYKSRFRGSAYTRIPLSEDLTITFFGNIPPSLFRFSSFTYERELLSALVNKFKELDNLDGKEYGKIREILNSINSLLTLSLLRPSAFGFTSYPVGGMLINYKRHSFSLTVSPNIEGNKPSYTFTYTTPSGDFAIAAELEGIHTLKPDSFGLAFTIKNFAHVKYHKEDQQNRVDVAVPITPLIGIGGFVELNSSNTKYGGTLTIGDKGTTVLMAYVKERQKTYSSSLDLLTLAGRIGYVIAGVEGGWLKANDNNVYYLGNYFGANVKIEIADRENFNVNGIFKINSAMGKTDWFLQLNLLYRLK
jgi:hypothetical protein